jgi:carbon starvation protein
MIGRAGGAPAFAVGMAVIFADALRSPGATALWYHFAIMFEALFILTTIDAGTRVGRFLTQDLMKRFVPNLSPGLSSFVASFLFVGAWGWFLYQGVIDPLGGINTFWPIFGIANQLLAVISLAFGTVLLFKMGRARYAWVTGLPLLWLTTVALTAGWQKIFSTDPRLGFLSQAAQLRTQIPFKTGAEKARLDQILFSQYVNVAVTAILMTLVLLILAACLRKIYLLQVRKKQSDLQESPFVALEG